MTDLLNIQGIGKYTRALTPNECALLLCIIGIPSEKVKPTAKNPDPRDYLAIDDCVKIIIDGLDPFKAEETQMKFI